jgi:large subunit ribosomal protein L7/L12
MTQDLSAFQYAIDDAASIKALVETLNEEFDIDVSHFPVVKLHMVCNRLRDALDAETCVVTLTDFNERKIAVVKAIRDLTTMGLKEAKELVESAPVVVFSGPKYRANVFVDKLRGVGAEVTIYGPAIDTKEEASK